jgi:hypothetical protein
LAALVRQAIVQPEKMVDLGRQARQIAMNTYHSDIHMAHLTRLYASIMASSPQVRDASVTIPSLF